MAEIKLGSVVYLNSFPEIKFTVVSFGRSAHDIEILGYDKNKFEFVKLSVRSEAVTLVDASK